MNKIQLNQNVVLFTEPTTRFKETTLVLRYMFPLKAKESTVAALLANMMQDRSEVYPTKQAMDYASDMLYGLTLSARTTSIGKTQMIELRSRCINGGYVQEALLEQQIQFLSDCGERVLMSEDTLNEAKKTLRSALLRDREKPVRLALKQAMQAGYSTQPIAISANGELDEIDQVSLSQIKAFHAFLLDGSRIEVSLVGDFDQSSVVDSLKRSFHFYDREILLDFAYQAEKSGPRDLSVQENLSQSTLVKFISTSIAPTKKIFTALRLANCMFGEIPSSILFQEVREKRSLCYSIFSTLLSYDGLMVVVTSVDDANIELTDTLVDDLLQQFKQSADADLLQSAKETLLVRYQTIDDDAYSIIDYQLRNNCLGLTETPQDMMDQINACGIEDIRQAIQYLQFSFNFMLRTKEIAE